MNKYFWTKEETAIVRKIDLTLTEMMQLLPNRTYSGIRGQIKKLGLKLSKESISKAHTLAQLGIKESDINNIKNDNNFLDIINGNLLGDGWIDKSYNFGLANIKKDLIEYVNLELNRIFKSNSKIGIKLPSEGEINGKKFNRKKQYYTNKSCKPVFSSLYHKWYKNGGKIVPDELDLTPRCCYFWYVGDGCIRCRKERKSASITLATNAFSVKDVEKLIDKLKNKIDGFDASINYSYGMPVIFICGRHVLSFLDYIGSGFLKSFSYKWNLNGYSQRKTICKICDKEFIHYGFKKNYRTQCSICRKGLK